MAVATGEETSAPDEGPWGSLETPRLLRNLWPSRPSVDPGVLETAGWRRGSPGSAPDRDSLPAGGDAVLPLGQGGGRCQLGGGVHFPPHFLVSPGCGSPPRDSQRLLAQKETETFFCPTNSSRCAWEPRPRGGGCSGPRGGPVPDFLFHSSHFDRRIRHLVTRPAPSISLFFTQIFYLEVSPFSSSQSELLSLVLRKVAHFVPIPGKPLGSTWGSLPLSHS